MPLRTICLRVVRPSFFLESAMTGHVDLVCGLSATGSSQLRSQSFQAPMHISKPYLDEETLVVNVVNSTAGLFEGDRIGCDFRVESGSRLLLTSPSASRAHRMDGGGEARLTQQFSVEGGGWLEIFTEPFIPQAGSRYTQKSIFKLEEGSGLLFFEALSPGRVASGEVFKFDYMDWEAEVWHAGQRIVREKYRIVASTMRSIVRKFPTGYYASIFFFHPELTVLSACWKEIDALHTKLLWVGHSELRRSGWTIKILAPDSVSFRKTVHRIRQFCYSAVRKKAPNLRK